MNKIDKIICGDNQFFGINHMSQEKAQHLAEKYFDLRNVFRTYDAAFESGIRAVMLNSNARAKDICDYFRKNSSKYDQISWYPSIPYPHKYADLVAEKGVLAALSDVLFSNNSVLGTLGMLAKGGIAALQKDVVTLMKMLVDLEFQMFAGLNVKVLFLQNIIVDLLLGYGAKDLFRAFCDHVREKHKTVPGFITQNLPYLKRKLAEWNIDEVVVSSSINKIGYLMSPSVEAYLETIRENDSEKYPLMAMCTMASGAVPAKEAIPFINGLNIQSVVFGSSSENNIRETVDLIRI